jgi:Rha family phage regulatory protein
MSDTITILDSHLPHGQESAESSGLAEVITHELVTADGQITATSLQVAEHFDKLHKDVLRAIKNLEIPDDYRERNFAPTINQVPGPKGAVREELMYRITRDGFALLAMGFTGKEAMRWKLAHIQAFNKMEAKLRSLYVEPMLDPSDKQFRKGIPLRFKLTLQAQGRRAMNDLLNESRPEARRNLYWQLRQINDALGIPTDSMEVLGVEQPVVERIVA